MQISPVSETMAENPQIMILRAPTDNPDRLYWGIDLYALSQPVHCSAPQIAPTHARIP
jgi:hypothetical protein